MNDEKTLKNLLEAFDHVVIIGFFVAISVNMASSYDYTAVMNESKSFIDTYNFTTNITTSNENWSFMYMKNSATTSDIQLIGISAFNDSYINTSYSFNFSVNVSMLNDDIIYYIYYNSTSNVSGFKSLYYQANITNVTLIQPTWARIDTGAFEYKICSYFLPAVFSKVVSISGSNGSVINMTATKSWITPPSNVTMPSTNYSTVIVNGTVPQINVGVYDEYVYFVGNNFSYSLNFRFTIEDCGIVLSYQKYLDVCNAYTKGSNDYQVCLIEAQNKYTTDWLYYFAQENKTEVTYVNVTRDVEVPVEVVRANQTLKDLIDSAAILNTQLNQQITQKQIDDANRNAVIAQLQSQVNTQQQIIGQFPKQVNETATLLFEQAWTKSDLKKKWYYYTAIVCIVIILGAVGFYKYKQNFWY